MNSIQKSFDFEETSSSDDDSDPEFDIRYINRSQKKKKKTRKRSQLSLRKLREMCRVEGFGSSFKKSDFISSGGSSLVAMATAQPSGFSGRLQQGGGGGEGGGGGAGSQQQLQSVSITPVNTQQQQQVLTVQQNGGVIEVDSVSEESSNGGQQVAQVTAQVVVSSGTNTPSSGDEQSLVGSPAQQGQHFITVAVGSDGEVVGGADAVAQGVQFVHYVEGSGDQAIYQTANGQMTTYPVYTVGGDAGGAGGMYAVPTVSQYYTGNNNTQVTYTPASGAGQLLTQGNGGQLLTQANAGQLLAQGNGGQLLAQGNGGQYLIQATVDPETAHSILQQRSSPGSTTTAVESYILFSGSPGKSVRRHQIPNMNGVHAMYRNPSYLGMVQWLLENYETAEGVSLPRSTLYNHYIRHCNDHKLDPVNAASFGKLIRSVFLGLRTRRLGTRGNSKYHYYGIRIKPSSSLVGVCEDGSPRGQAGNGGGGQKRFKFGGGGGGGKGGGGDQYEPAPSNNSCSQSPQGHEYEEIQVLTSNFNAQRQGQGADQHMQYLGDSSTAVPDFPDIPLPPGTVLPGDCTLEDVDTLRSIYREHCEAFLDAVVNLEFNTVESLWREFWRSQDNNNGDECEEEKYLSKTKLYLLCKCAPVQEFVRRVDYLFYQNLVEVLIPDVLRPIPSTLTQAIRNFAKGLEQWLSAAMQGCPAQMMHIKVGAVGALAQTLRRYTSLNHLAQAARAVLQNSAQIGQMLLDLNRVDFHNVQEQASWVCQCDDVTVHRLENDFKVTLQQQNSLEQWALWLKGVVQQVLKPYEGKPNYATAARQFLLKWSFYSSMVIRDLTLRSAASFGSFHLIRLLYDEYMFYLIEHQVAVETGETPIAVMGEKYVPGEPAGGSADGSADGLELGYMGQTCNGAIPSKRQKIS